MGKAVFTLTVLIALIFSRIILLGLQKKTFYYAEIAQTTYAFTVCSYLLPEQFMYSYTFGLLWVLKTWKN